MRQSKVKAAIVGASGYTGGEMLRLLLNHPQVELSYLNSRNHAGEPVYHVHSDLLGETDMNFSNELKDDTDVVFLCLGHGESKEFLKSNSFSESTRLIDLSQDFRLNQNAGEVGRTFVYGLPEKNRDKIKAASAVANPGCFATAIQLALLPLAGTQNLGEVFVTGITGSTGAGQKLSASSHFSWRANNVEAYKSLSHQHLDEIMENLRDKGAEISRINFIPWRGGFTRGIYVSATLNTELTLEDAYKLFEDFYRDSPFTFVSRKMINLKQVVNTNKCLIHLEKEGDRLVIHSAIDNLLKGAAGQALQNMNLMMDLPEEAGLKLKSISF